MIDQELLNILACPETKQSLELAKPDIVQRLNDRISQGSLRNRGDHQVTEPIDGGLIRQDQKVLYPIRNDIPVMLVEEAILLDGSH